VTRYITLAEQVTGVDAAVLAKAGRIDLADSALHTPAASFGGQEFHPTLLSKAAVLTTHLAWNHPLLDGNKRAAWAALVMFIDLNGGQWHPDPPDVDEAEQAMLDVAAHQADEAWFADWRSSRVRFPEPKSHDPEL